MKLLIILLCIGGWTTWAAPEIQELIAPMMEAEAHRSQISKVVPESQRSKTVHYLRALCERSSYENRMSAEILLVNLNDDELIKSLIMDYGSDDFKRFRRASPILSLSCQLAVIPYLASPDFVFKEETKIICSTGESMYLSQSVRSAQVILSILSRSPDVSEEVQQWAKKNQRGFGLAAVHCRDVVRKWWPQNKAFFESGEYEKIRPLMDEAIPAPQKAPVAEDLDVKMLDSENTVTGSVAPDEPNERSFSWAGVILGSISVVLLAGLFLRQTRT